MLDILRYALRNYHFWPKGGRLSRTLLYSRESCMLLLILGLLLFIGMHVIPSFEDYRNKIVSDFGEQTYKGFFSLSAFAGIVAIVYGKGSAEFIDLWTPPAWGRMVVSVAMLGTAFLFCAMYAPSNIKRVTRHPMLWGVFLWSLGHLCANGDLASVLLFGSFGAFSLFAMWSANKRGATKSRKQYPFKNDAAIVAVSVVVYGIVMFLHPYFAGVALLPQ